MGLFDFIFPKKCLECSASGKYICPNCLEKVRRGQYRNNNYSIFKYKGVIRRAIITIKYKFAYDIAEELASICVDRLKTYGLWHNANLVPIPLDRKRENFRGFNQTEILGKKIAEKLNLKFIPDLLIKTKETKHQVGLKGVDRKNNLKNVFEVNKLYIQYTIPNILLFDDVYTTGTTINEAKKTLQNADFKNIKSLTIAS